MKNVNRLIIFLVAGLIILCFGDNIATSGEFAAESWSELSHYLAVHPGTQEPVWSNPENSKITEGAVKLNPVGDGTFEIVLKLQAGGDYNYILFARTGDSPPTGLQANYEYYDAVPGGGRIQAGTQPLVDADTTFTPAYYSSVGSNYDNRRVLSIPKTLSAGDSLYIYNNFAGRQTPPRNFAVGQYGDSATMLVWDYPVGNWGASGEWAKAPDVIAGGTYTILRGPDTANLTPIDSISGNKKVYVDTGLNSDSTYYYSMIAKDLYGGTDTQPFTQLSSDTTAPDSVNLSNPKIPCIFLVHGLDWEYVQEHNHKVYLTPDSAQNKYFARRIPGVIARIDMKAGKTHRREGILRNQLKREKTSAGGY